ncbi:MAG: hypothetical protein JXR41_03615 [Bacteroidales bacterium]|nr:hypothetical protein [Bacteroidales bacterium]MBN2762154.1 hypothetical protein [Bacteroidales bacterium]
MIFSDRQYFTSVFDRVDKHVLFRTCLFLLFLPVLWVRSADAQETNADTVEILMWRFAQLQQADQHLIHGTRHYDLYPFAPGHAFMEPDEFMTGSIIIHQREYKPVRLKYDICNQRVLMRYPQNIGGYGEIVLINDFIEGFEIGEKFFRIYTLPKKGPQYCQEIGTDSLKCLYFWHKELVPLNNSLESYNQYTNEKKDAFLFIDGQIFPVKGKRSFRKLFPVSVHHAIKAYMRENRITLRDVSDQKMYDLILFCYSLREGQMLNTQGGL